MSYIYFDMRIRNHFQLVPLSYTLCCFLLAYPIVLQHEGDLPLYANLFLSQEAIFNFR